MQIAEAHRDAICLAAQFAPMFHLLWCLCELLFFESHLHWFSSCNNHTFFLSIWPYIPQCQTDVLQNNVLMLSYMKPFGQEEPYFSMLGVQILTFVLLGWFGVSTDLMHYSLIASHMVYCGHDSLGNKCCCKKVTVGK